MLYRVSSRSVAVLKFRSLIGKIKLQCLLWGVNQLKVLLPLPNMMAFRTVSQERSKSAGLFTAPHFGRRQRGGGTAARAPLRTFAGDEDGSLEAGSHFSLLTSRLLEPHAGL